MSLEDSSLRRRRGQNGHIEKSGRWFVVRFWQDVAGQEKRALVRVRICPVSGTGSLNLSERKRRARQIVQESGADTVEHFERVVLNQTGTIFREQADTWLDFMSNPRRSSRKSGLPTAASTLATWKGIVEKLKAELGDLPLRSLV